MGDDFVHDLQPLAKRQFVVLEKDQWRLENLRLAFVELQQQRFVEVGPFDHHHGAFFNGVPGEVRNARFLGTSLECLVGQLEGFLCDHERLGPCRKLPGLEKATGHHGIRVAVPETPPLLEVSRNFFKLGMHKLHSVRVAVAKVVDSRGQAAVEIARRLEAGGGKPSSVCQRVADIAGARRLVYHL